MIDQEPDTHIASLIYFKKGTSKARIERWIKALEEKGVIDASTTREYNNNHGNPVWYIP